MFGAPFGHGTMRKYVIFFGTMFNNIWLQRFNPAGELVQRMKVPLNYGPREKFLARLEGNPTLDRPIAIQLPRMAFELTNTYYDPSRKTSTLNKVYNVIGPGNVKYQYAPVPYNFEFTLSIMVKNAEDATYIVEQILPYFTPEWTATLKINPDIGDLYDIPVQLDNVSHEDTYEGQFEERRALIWTLVFTMKGWLFGPTKGGAGTKIITNMDINLINPAFGLGIKAANSTNTDAAVNINIQPGMFSNSAPTSETNNVYYYTLSSPTGEFIPGEKMTVNSTAYAFCRWANSTVASSRNNTGNIANSSVLTGEVSGVTATVTNVTIDKPLSVDRTEIQADDNYGFIIDFTERIF